LRPRLRIELNDGTCPIIHQDIAGGEGRGGGLSPPR
jgi:hypothetical protein